MTAFATALTFAALVCEPEVAPFFVLPCPAVTNRALRKRAIPQRVNATNYFGRLDGDVMSALYGTTEALFERRLFPLMMNYGGARFAPASKLATVDFGDGNVKDLYSTNWFAKYDGDIVPPCFARGESRDFSNRFTRVAWPIDLLDGFVYGTRGILADTNNVIGAASRSAASDNLVAVDVAGMPITRSLDISRDPRVSYAWLVPKAFSPEDNGPYATWCLNNATATADWSGSHLLTLGEIDLRDCCPSELFGYERSPWSDRPPAQDLLPEWANDFMYQLSEGPSYDKDIFFDKVYHSQGKQRDAKNKISGRDLFWDYPTNDPPHIATSNVTSRFYGERFAFANVTLSLCERSVDYPKQVAWVEATNTTAYPVAPAPRFRYRQRRFSGHHGGSMTMSSEDGCKIIPDGEGFWLVWDLSKFSEGKMTTTNEVSAVTSVVEHVTAGWSEGTPVACATSPISLSGSEFRPYFGPVEANSNADFDNYDWGVVSSFDGNTGDGQLWYSVYVYGNQTKGDPVAPFIDPIGGGYFAFIGSVCFKTAEDIPADIYLSYEAGYKGVEPLFVRPLKGPTSLEAPDVTNETEWSIAPAPRAQFLWDKGIVKSVDVNKFTTVGVSTNETLLTGIVEDGKAFDYTYRENIWDRQNDTWMYFKYDEAFTEITSHSQLLANFELFHLTWLDDIKSRAAANPSGNNTEPTLDIAKALPKARVKSALTSLMESSETIVSNYLRLAIGSSCAYYGKPLVTQDPYNKSSWGANVAASDFKIGLEFNLSTNLPPRKSAAYGYDAKPVIITNWKFPMMREESQDK